MFEWQNYKNKQYKKKDVPTKKAHPINSQFVVEAYLFFSKSRISARSSS